ncbi:zygote arrest protein 1 [Lemur catta]|uniref:zygote arrest protein 1 n=1 Tax=Lemur catta TaxID=9447 RepID=UPI001E26B2E8|nr:zygote arrest protein 1 [Lemur catta]
MAALGDEVLDGYVFPACPPYPYPYPYPYPSAAKGKGAADRGCPPASSSSSAAGATAASFPGFGQQAAAKLFDSYQRAQLMALLSQVSPSPGPRRAGSRDAAVQVNPRSDAAVQCSLGRRTLRRAGDPGVPTGPGPAEGATGGGPQPVRFPRTVAVYSSAAPRRPAAVPEAAEAGAGEQRPGAAAAERGSPPARAQGPGQGQASARKAPPRPEDHDATRAAAREAEVGEAAPLSPPRSPARPPPAGRAPDGSDGGGDGRDGGETVATAERSSLKSPEQGKERLRFQFLEQKYGYYHCKDCNIRWESAYVWCVQGTNKVYFKQFCRTCPKSYNPYRVEDITCQSCKQTRCSCPVKLRHVDPKRPHRQDLCGRCKGKRLSCDSTFSFKYII